MDIYETLLASSALSKLEHVPRPRGVPGAGTANGPESLGPKAPKSGLLKEGYDADFIGLDKNPFGDIEILGDPRNITQVWKGGKMYKSGWRPISILD